MKTSVLISFVIITLLLVIGISGCATSNNPLTTPSSETNATVTQESSATSAAAISSDIDSILNETASIEVNDTAITPITTTDLAD
jgi:hypothetical protein